ncbi:MAG TPA: thiolase family protein [Bdellovibrionota bacterium]|nr:thiolase family protein [Bdellovibrionota bacterium]
MTHDIVIVGAGRTPIGKFGGGLASLSAAQLGGSVGCSTISVSGITPDKINLCIFGHARQAGGGPNTARRIVRLAGLSDAVPAYTVNQACASGLRAIVNAAQSIQTGEAEVVLAGGTESMSNTPYLLTGARWGYRMGHSEVVDGMYRDGFLCPLCGMVMGETAEKLVRQEGITRADQDAYAAESQKKWLAADQSGRWNREIAPVEVAAKGGIKMVTKDEHPRPDSTVESMAKLPPVFVKDGSVHAGNSSGITDGAAACIVTTAEKAKKLGLKPMARLVAHATVGVDPSIMGIGPVSAVEKLLAKTQLKLREIDLIELNEAFAGQVLACAKHLELDLSKVNVSGGAIALGHPIGATGARIVTTLLHEMEILNAKRGIATLCVSGGMGIAALFER